VPISFNNIREDLFSRGIDSHSAENQIPEGFVRDSQNANIVQKYISKRPGLAGFAGNLPVRVESVEYDNANSQICFTLNAATDLLSIRSTPIVVSGRLSSNIGTTGPFTTTDSSKYYPGFIQNTRQEFGVGTGSIAVPGTSHGLGTSNMFVEVSESLSATNLSNKLVDYDELRIDTISADIDIDYINSTPAPIPVFTYYLSRDPEVGTVYVGAGAGPIFIHDGTPVAQSFTISAAVHQLSNFQIVARCYQVSGSDRILVTPDSLTIDTATGLVTVEITNDTGLPQQYYCILSAAPATQFKQGLVTGSTYTISIPAPDSPFIFPGVYADDGSGTISQVIPEEISYDSTLDLISITFENPGALGFRLYWEYGTIRSNTICVEDSTMDASGSDTAPQLTLWGLDHAEIWGADAGSHAGWTNHIDSYRISGEQRVVAGNSGVLYTSRTFNENGISHLYGSAYPRLFGRLASSVTVAPAFWGTGQLAGRSRGYITGDDLDDNWATVSAVSWDSGVAGGTVRLDMPVTNLAFINSVGTPITINNTNLEACISVDDEITLQGMSYSRHNGTFRIAQRTVSGSTISIWVYNDQVDSADWDDAGCAGLAGVFTDRVTFQADSPFLPGDGIISDAIPATVITKYVRSVTGDPTSCIINGIDTAIVLQSGLQLTGTRTSQVIPLRLGTDVASVENIVRGDILVQSNTQLPLRVQFINTLADTSISLVGDGEIATATVSDTTRLSAGGRVLILHADGYTGEQEITEVVSSTEFTFSSTETAPASGTLVGNTVHIGEAIEWSDTTGDTNTFDVTHRFIPVEAPEDSYTQTVDTHPYYFQFNDPDEQRLLRSTMAQDNLYLTNGVDPVMKFDGVNIYQAGLPNWQPGVLIRPDTTAPNPIVTNRLTVPTVSVSIATGSFVTTKENAVFDTGDRVQLTGSTTIFTIRGKEIDGTNIVYRLAPGSMSGVVVGSASNTSLYRYYYRLNAVDVNNNIVASAIAQSEDYQVELSADAAIYHKLVGLPPFGTYDYDRIYLQAYRTLANASSTFYLVHQERVDYNSGRPYINFTDSLRDANLLDLDPTAILKSGELGIGWAPPPKASAITSAGGNLFLGNIRKQPEVSIQLTGTPTYSDVNTHTVEFQRGGGSAPVTDPANNMTYEFVSGPGVSHGIGTYYPNSSFTLRLPVASAPVAGNWVFLDSTLGLNMTDGARFNSTVWASATQSDGKVLVAGQFTNYAGISGRNRLVRLTAGEDLPDEAFCLIAVDGAKFNDTIRSLVVQPDGKILVGGDFNSYAGAPGRHKLVRLNADGTLDTTFCGNAVDGAKFNAAVLCLAIQSDGKILVGGSFTNYAGTVGRSYLIRLNADGTLDTTFCGNAVDGAKFNFDPYSLAIQSDGKILVGGEFTNYAGTANRHRLIRLNITGTLDTSFCVNATDSAKFTNIVIRVITQSDGKILVGGDFSNYAGTSGRNKLIRLEADGTLDTTFCGNAVDGTKFSSTVWSLSAQSDGKILVGGSFTNYAGTSGRHALVRLATDGTLDTAFCGNAVDGAKFNSGSLITGLVIQSDGRILVGGGFSSYAGTSGRHFFVRLYAAGTLGTSTAPSLPTSGWWRIDSVGGTPGAWDITILNPTIQNVPPAGSAYLATYTAGYHRVPVPMPNPAIPADALNDFGQINGNTDLTIFQMGRRLACAINASMAVLGFTGVSPWLAARGGNDTGVSGLITITNPSQVSSSLTVKWIGATNYLTFLNGIQQVSGTTVPTQEAVFPSRVVVSYQNFPEIFDNIGVPLDTQSDSAIDVNPSDGQEITALIPFFGEAAFGSSQQSAVVVAFKQNSIYLIDINQKRAGQNPVQRIESGGVGCTFPGSVAATKRGIMFAHESGIYILRKNLGIDYVGKFVGRPWKQVDKDLIDEVQGHNYTSGRTYKLSVPLLSGDSQVFTYDHTNEEEAGGGSWGRYTNHNSIGWCNLGQDAYVATRTGRVMVVRRRGDLYDFQDDHSPIDFYVHTRPLDFGAPGVRKALDTVTGFYRTEYSSNTVLGLSVDTEQEYDVTTPIRILKPGQLNGLGDTVTRDIETIKHSMKRRRGTQFSITISNSTRLEGVDLAGIDFRVGLLGQGQGLREASDTTRKK
jgi:uncharacterized delta-60 repeat protein